MSRGQPPSVGDLRVIENAVAQMEFWNSLVCLPRPKENAMPFSPKEVGAQAEKLITKFESDVSVAGADNQESSVIQARPIDTSKLTGATVQEAISAEEVSANGAELEDDIEGQPTMSDGEHRCFEHVSLQNTDPLANAGKVFVDTPSLGKSPVAITSRQPPQPLNGVSPANRRETVPPCHFSFKRKLMSNFFNLSLPARMPHPLSLAVADSSPILDSGISLAKWQIDAGESFEQTQVPKDVVIRNLVLRKVLGVGAQGKVYLAQARRKNGSENPPLFAVKVIIKERCDNRRMILQEQDVMKRLKGHRFLLELEGSFHDTKNFYLISQYHVGRDLNDLLRCQGSLDVSAARFYSAELCSAIAFLHQNWIVHRDIKLSNILIKADGHICLGDFGLCADCSSQMPTESNEDCFLSNAEPVICGIAGTTAYMAPEVLRGELYSSKVDWWSCGITIYNLLEGHFPWPVTDKLWLAEIAGVVPPRFRITTNTHAKSFVEVMLRKDPNGRLGSVDVFDHPFFNGIDVQDIHNGKLRPPFIPTRELATSLRLSDGIHTGRKYSNGNIPMAEYIFYGSNFNAPDSSISADSGTYVSAFTHLCDFSIPPDDQCPRHNQYRDSVSTLPPPIPHFASGKTLTVHGPTTTKYPVGLDDASGMGFADYEAINEFVQGMSNESVVEPEGCECPPVGTSERQVKQVYFASSHFDNATEPGRPPPSLSVPKASSDKCSSAFVCQPNRQANFRVLEAIKAQPCPDRMFTEKNMPMLNTSIQVRAIVEGIEKTNGSMAVPPFGIDDIDAGDDPPNEDRKSNMVKNHPRAETVLISWSPSSSPNAGLSSNDDAALSDPSSGLSIFACGLPSISMPSSYPGLSHTVDFGSTLDDSPMVDINLEEPHLPVLPPERQQRDIGVHSGPTSLDFLNVVKKAVEWAKRLNHFLASNWTRITGRNTMRDLQASSAAFGDSPGNPGSPSISL